MNPRLYFDWNASAPLRAEARAAMLSAIDLAGNPSSVHAEGRAARRIIEQARENVAALVGSEPRNVVFTSGGSEANMLALWPATDGATAVPGRLLVSAIEHPSVLAGGRFAASEVERVPVTPRGEIDLASLADRLATGAKVSLISVMLANNETGIIQPVAKVAALAHQAGAFLHVDAVQGPGRISCDINQLGADLLTVSGHKIGAPKGVGALVRRSSETPWPASIVKGGGQERGARAGTENVIGIAGFGAAARAAREEWETDRERLVVLRKRLEAGLRASTPKVVIFGSGAQRLPNTILFALTGTKAETAVIAFDLEGVAVSSGAACSSGKVQPSHVLAAMGVAPDLARAAVRVSIGRTTTESEVDLFVSAWNNVSASLLKQQRIAAA